jgi:peptidoglycan/LPS O-acetylase OafA/YrhL
MLVMNAMFFDNHVIPYISGGFFVAWIWFLFPFLWKKVMPMLLLAIDALALLTYLYTFKILGDDSGWFALVAMPVVITMWALGNGFILLFKKVKRKSIRTAAILGAINIMSFVIEICLNMFYLGRLQIPVSLIVTACCVSLMVFFIVLAKSKRLNEWVSRKFFM